MRANDNSISWIPQTDVTAMACDLYWLVRNEKDKARRRKRRKSGR